jgi:very-short-patch-repair endonuclease
MSQSKRGREKRPSVSDFTRLRNSERAHTLRVDQTEAEARLWNRLRDRRLAGAKFRRQHPTGPYIVDFCCVERRLIVEVDGGQHSEADSGDERRSAYLASFCFKVLRFWNTDVLSNIEGVLGQIEEYL